MSARRKRDCLGPFQDAVVAETVREVEAVFARIAKARNVDEADLRAWVAWSAHRLPEPSAA